MSAPLLACFVLLPLQYNLTDNLDYGFATRYRSFALKLSLRVAETRFFA
jgi:hypothetical protein